MKKIAYINEQIKSFNNKIYVPGDKSLSIRWILMASQAVGISTSSNLLRSEDVLSALNAVKRLGINYKINKKICKIYGKGLNGLNYKNNTIINAGNSGTLARLIFGLLINSKNQIILKGDKSLSKRDFSRVIKPMRMFGENIKSKNQRLPIIKHALLTHMTKPVKLRSNTEPHLNKIVIYCCRPIKGFYCIITMLLTWLNNL